MQVWEGLGSRLSSWCRSPFAMEAMGSPQCTVMVQLKPSSGGVLTTRATKDVAPGSLSSSGARRLSLQVFELPFSPLYLF